MLYILYLGTVSGNMTSVSTFCKLWSVTNHPILISKFLRFLFQTQMLFIDAFIQNNRLDHVTQVIGYHPDYLDCFLRTQQYLLRGDGPLPYHYRHYIAILVSQHGLFTPAKWFWLYKPEQEYSTQWHRSICQVLNEQELCLNIYQMVIN